MHAPQQAGAVGTPRVSTGVNSPAAAMLGMGPFLAGTGMTPAGMATDVGGSVDGVGVGVLGLSARDQEAERGRRIEEIVRIVGKRWGRVSPEGVERCARRVGLECLWEEGQGQHRTLSIAGQGVLIDVEFTEEEVGAVVLSFPDSGEGVGKGGAEGAEVLRRDLKGQQREGYVMLDAFVKNLERLAGMDRLGERGVSCFDAVEGIHYCLKRIYEWELKRREEGQGKEQDLEMEIMCEGSGRPRMHTRGQVGLAVQYWAERRFVRRKRKAEEMEIDSDRDHPGEREEELHIYSALIECEASPSSLYPPIRVSSDWVSASIEKPPSTDPQLFPISADSSINWQEPPPTLLSDNGPPALMNMDPAPLLSCKTPNARFVARLQPPIVVPLQVAIDIYESVSAPLAQESIEATTYESLLFAAIDAAKPSSPKTAQPRVVEQTVTSYDSTGTATDHRHKYALFTPPQSYARLIENIPFSHPRQLIAVLPVLRQWALIGSILRRSFIPPPPPTPDIKAPNNNNNDDDTQPASHEILTVEEELAALLAPSPPPASSPLPVDISLSLTLPIPRLSAIFEHQGRLRTVVLGFGLNGLVVGVGGEKDRGRPEEGEGRVGDLDLDERVRRVVMLSESVGVAVAWFRIRGRGG